MPSMKVDPRIDPRTYDQEASAAHKEYVDRAEDFFIHFETSRLPIWEKALEWWDMFLARQKDERDPVDEMWRSNVFVPLPFSTTRTKAAQLVEHIANAEPVWQVEARRENAFFYEESKPVENLLQYTVEQNAFRKFFLKVATARSVQGTAFFKVVYTKRSHRITLYPTQRDYEKFLEAVQNAQMMGAPYPPDFLSQPEEFEQWRRQVNTAQRFGVIPAPPLAGPRQSTEYEGPLFQYVPIWHVYLDPLVDEITDQRFIIHRMVKPLSYILARADDLPPGASNKPYLKAAVEDAMNGWTGELLTSHEQSLAEKLKLNPLQEQHPYLEGGKAVELWEIWSPDEAFRYAIVMNRKRVINKTPFENPLLTTAPNLFALRNIIVPGFFDGLSDYQEPETLFIELNKFRRLRQDGATLTTLPVFVKQAGLALGDALRKLRPGMVLSVPGNVQAVTSLIRHTLPPEAYREPPEMKEEIADATEVPPYLKGAQAQIGRVTGTEFQGRAQRADLKYKVDAAMAEDEMIHVPNVVLSFWAQMKGDVRIGVGGEPDTLTEMSKDEVIAEIGRRFRLRGVTRAVDPDLQVQHLLQAFAQSRDVMTPGERRFGLQLILEMMDVRGWSKVITTEGTQQITGAAAAQTGAATAEAGATAAAAGAATQPAPSQLSPAQAKGMESGGGGQGGQG